MGDGLLSPASEVSGCDSKEREVSALAEKEMKIFLRAYPDARNPFTT